MFKLGHRPAKDVNNLLLQVFLKTYLFTVSEKYVE